MLGFVVLANAAALDGGAMRQMFDDMTTFGDSDPYKDCPVCSCDSPWLWPVSGCNVGCGAKCGNTCCCIPGEGKCSKVDKYDDHVFESITTCMKESAPGLYPTSQDAAWAGFSKYGYAKGQPSDPWGAFKPIVYKEHDPTPLFFNGEAPGMQILEPCNFLSNLAYYRFIPDLCANKDKLEMTAVQRGAIVQAFAALGMGSAFFHASQTALGETFDTALIDLLAYDMWQMAAANMASLAGERNASMILDLSATPRRKSSVALCDENTKLFSSQDVDNWNATISKMDRPIYYLTFTAIIGTIITMVAPETIADKIITTLMKAFTPPLPQDVADTFLQKILPSIRASLRGVKVSSKDQSELRYGLFGTVLKLLWAFVWQEEVFQYGSLYTESWNAVGSVLTSTVNSVANGLTGFSHPDESLQQNKKMYPGQGDCDVKKTAPHAKWHVQSANALMDLTYLCDKVSSATRSLGRGDEPHSYMISVQDFESLVDEARSKYGPTKLDESAEAFFDVIRKTLASIDGQGGDADGIITWEKFQAYLEAQVDGSLKAASWRESFAQAIMSRLTAEEIAV